MKKLQNDNRALSLTYGMLGNGVITIATPLIDAINGLPACKLTSIEASSTNMFCSDPSILTASL